MLLKAYSKLILLCYLWFMPSLHLIQSPAKYLVNDPSFRFASYYSDHMVLQKNHQGAVVWGTSSKMGDTVQISLNGQEVSHGTVTPDKYGGMMWMVNVPSASHKHGPYNLTARSSLGTITLHDVMFGDVWVCSGQSNMAYPVSWLENATAEYTDASNYKNVRLLKTRVNKSNTPLGDFHQPTLWTTAEKSGIKHFSALCWLFGKQLSSQLGYPIGLIESSVSGQKIEQWSSTEAMNACQNTSVDPRKSELWNAMINPLTRLTIYGVISYQEERNTGSNADYACQFPAMIKDWRNKFYTSSGHTTSSHFPFGFVQLAPSNNSSAAVGGFPAIRWKQTAGYGTVPNEKMPNTFMAVAMDLPDLASPHNPSHLRYKHDIAFRLALSALAVAYHKHRVKYQGPYPSNFHIHEHTLIVEYGQRRVPITVNSNVLNFEICCSAERCDMTLGIWKPAPITSYESSSLTLKTRKCGRTEVSALRYAWRESPCLFKQCAVYGRDTNLPAPPFFHSFHA